MRSACSRVACRPTPQHLDRADRRRRFRAAQHVRRRRPYRHAFTNVPAGRTWAVFGNHWPSRYATSMPRASTDPGRGRSRAFHRRFRRTRPTARSRSRVCCATFRTRESRSRSGSARHAGPPGEDGWGACADGRRIGVRRRPPRIAAVSPTLADAGHQKPVRTGFQVVRRQRLDVAKPDFSPEGIRGLAVATSAGSRRAR